jgi:hypothetical protein
MNKNVQIFKAPIFQNEVNALSFKENNFTFKMTRLLVEMLKAEHDISHLVKIDKIGFEKPLYAMKTKKDIRVILILESNDFSPEYTLTLLRCVRLHDLTEVVETLDTEMECAPFEFRFNEFW